MDKALTTNRRLDPVTRTRRNHALEHATLQVLAMRNPHRLLAGHSDPGGFWIIGTVSTDELADAAVEALARLRKGERGLAVHPNCGTNLAASGMAAGLAGWVGMLGVGSGARRKFDRLPWVMLLATVALILAQPLGPWLQAKITTDADMGSMQLAEVVRSVRPGLMKHRVRTRV